MNKKAAMFGLDARIALTIFGALSIISGAALYSAIQQAQVIRLATTFSNIEKAVGAYLLDTGQDIPSSGRYHNTTELLTSNINGWKGPYYNGTYTTAPAISIALPEYNNWSISILNQQGSDYGNINDTTLEDCVTGVPCYYWIKAYIEGSGYNDSMIDKLDKHIDNSDGLDKGKIRMTIYNDGADHLIIYYKMMPLITKK